MTTRGCLRARWASSLAVTGAALLIGAALPSVASAEPAGEVAVTPAPGARVASGQPLTFSVTLPTSPPRYGLTLEVSTQNTPGQDGTLANDYVVAMVTLVRSDASPTVYRGTANAGNYNWLTRPGKYYWQASTFEAGVTYATAVYEINVGAAASPRYYLAMKDAIAAARAAVRIRFGSATRIRAGGCTRISEPSFKCVASWQRRGHRYRATLILARGGTGITYRFGAIRRSGS